MLKPFFVFPKLIYLHEFEKKHEDGKISTHQLYSLDWSKFNIEIEKDFRERIDKSIYKGMSYYGALPEKWETTLHSFIFSLNSNYLQEIRSNIIIANTGWSTPRPFDTMIRDICLGPYIESIYVAFRLLGDCVFDIDDGYFSRKLYRKIATQLMLVKFWTHQTGRGLIEDHARMSILDECLKLEMVSKEYKDYVSQFLKDYREYHEQCDNEFYKHNANIKNGLPEA